LRGDRLWRNAVACGCCARRRERSGCDRRFDTNVDPKLPWAFVPEQRGVKVRIGEDKLVFFRA
jgi:cytochrome c oxidase assembly protein Cox11